MREKIIADIPEKLFEEAIQFRRWMHQYPELSNEEYKTTERIIQELIDADIKIESINLKTGVIASVGKGESSRNLYLRADIDALPLEENSGLSFSSKNKEVAHCCGHDIHTSTLLLTAKYLKLYEDYILGKIVFIFQPAEEKMNGADQIIESGIFDKIKPTAILGIHTWPELPAGTVGLKKGPFMSASDLFNIKIKGKSGHGAHPHKAIDPICIAGYVLTALQTVVSRVVAPNDAAVITVGKIYAGSAANIIPEEAVMEGTVRTADKEVQQKIKTTMGKLISSVVEGFGGIAEFTYVYGHPAVYNHADIIDKINSAASKVLKEDNIVWLEKASMGSEDFSHYLELAPGAMFRIGTANNDIRSTYSLHNREIIFDEEAILTGAKVLVQVALDFFK